VDRIGGRGEPTVLGHRHEQPEPPKIHKQILCNCSTTCLRLLDRQGV
jgi:hypothetical protein